MSGRDIPVSIISIGNMDMLIAAVAKSERLTLVTNNTAYFSRIAGLKIVNWVKR